MFKLTTVRTILAWIGFATVVIVFGTAVAEGWAYLSALLQESGVPINQ
jgi:hypothetical protein